MANAAEKVKEVAETFKCHKPEIGVLSVIDYTIFVEVNGVRKLFYATTSKTIMPGETCDLAGVYI